MENFNYRKNVRKYFMGARILPRILMIVGAILLIWGIVSLLTSCSSCSSNKGQQSSYSYSRYSSSSYSRYSSSSSESAGGTVSVLGIIFTLLGLASIGGSVYVAINGVKVAEAEVDQATKEEIDILKERGMKKLNIISEQVNIIDPIVIFGAGISPDSNLGMSSRKKYGTSLLFKLLLLPIAIIVAIVSIFKKKELNIDPFERYKIGSDTNLRYMLLQVTVFSFTENQLMMYSGNVDISTGIVYNETTAELFYTDISNISTNEELTKYFYKNHFVYKKREYVNIKGNGMNYIAGFTSDAIEGKSRIDNEFAGMRNLIRDKKISK